MEIFQSFFECSDFLSHTSNMVMFCFDLMAIVCVIANLLILFTKNDIIVHYNKFPNLGVHSATFPKPERP